MIDLNAIKNLNFKFSLGKGGTSGIGGDGGSIMIIAETIIGDGKIIVDGGDGDRGGKGGNVHIQAKSNNFKGKISAKGGEVYG